MVSEKLELTSTDGYRLTRVRIPILPDSANVLKEREIAITAKSLETLYNNQYHPAETTIKINKVTLRIGEDVLNTSMAPFPDVDKCIPKSGKGRDCQWAPRHVSCGTPALSLSTC